MLFRSLNGVTNRFAEVNNKSYAIFGQVTLTPPIWEDRLHLTLGGRYSEDKRLATVDSVLTNTPPVTPLDATGKAKFHSFKPAATLAADIAPDVNLYAKYATAFRSGGFNVRAIGNNDITYNTVNGPVTLSGFTTPFKPENITSFEIGFKGAFFDRRLRIGLALYDSTVKDAQILNIAPNQAPTPGLIAPVRNVTNAGKMRARGLEFDAQALLFDALRLSLNYSYFDGKYVDTLDTFGNNISKTLIVPFSPKNTINTALDYDLDLGSPGTLSFHVGYSWVDDVASFPDRKSTRLNSSHTDISRMPSSA